MCVLNEVKGMMIKMNIKFRYMTLDEISSVLAWSTFQTDGVLPLSESTYFLYPELRDKTNYLIDIKYEDRISIISELIKEKYKENIKEFNDKKLVEHYQKVWDKYNDKYFEILSSYFNVSMNKIADASIGLIPVCPRDIETLSFSLDEKNDGQIIDTCMHECCHFYFFELCKRIFNNLTNEDCNSPSLLWYLSEISIHAILNRDEFQKLFRHNFRTYDNFYDVMINNECVVDTIKNIFDNYDIENAIKIGLKYLTDNKEELIRKCNSEKVL